MTAVAWSSDVSRAPTDPPLPWARWRLDDWQDSSGNNRHLTPVVDVNGYPRPIAAPRGNGRNFTLAGATGSVGTTTPTNGAQRVLSANEVVALSTGPGLSFAFWLLNWRPIAVPGITTSQSYRLVEAGITAGTRTDTFSVRWNPVAPGTITVSNTLQLITARVSGALVTSPAIPYESWNHIAVAVTPLAGTGVITGNGPGTIRYCRADWYLNGVFLASTTRTGNGAGTSAGPALPLDASYYSGTQVEAVGVGCAALALQHGTHGVLNDVQIFNRAIGAADVALLYAQGKPPPIPTLVSFGA